MMMKKGQREKEMCLVFFLKRAGRSVGGESEWAAAKTVFASLSVFSGHES